MINEYDAAALPGQDFQLLEQTHLFRTHPEGTLAGVLTARIGWIFLTLWPSTQLKDL